MSATPRRPGRPRLDPDDATVHLHVRIPARAFDRADREARRAGLTLPEFVRRSVNATIRVLSPKLDRP